MNRIAIKSGRGFGKTERMRRQAKLYLAPAGTQHPVSVKDLEEWTELQGVKVLGWQREVLGNWYYSPAEELRDRLNDWLQGKQPVSAINTRFWRGL